jgi:ATP-dependent exoDNAse (exonuclease V) beta subunit
MKIGGWAPHELYQHEAEEVARDQAEGVRLAYVAATRARDLLVVPALGDEPWEGGWFGPLNAALYPPRDARRVSARGPRCPAFRSKDSVAERPGDEPAGMATVCPGLHTLPDGYSVVWWEPGAGGGLTPGSKALFGVRREELIVKDVPRHVIADGRTNYDRWRLARGDAREAGARPSASVSTVREWAAEPGSPGTLPMPRPDVAVVDLAATAQREGLMGGAAFGTLVHAVLAQAPFEASAEETQRIAMLEARILGLSDIEAEAASRVVDRVWTHPIIGRARAAAERHACRRETPITYTAPDGRVLEGTVDLAFEEQGHWYVVDYKTDRDPLPADGLYQRQVALYAAAIAHATGQPASGVIIRV